MTARIARGSGTRARPRAKASAAKKRRVGLLESMGLSAGAARRTTRFFLLGATAALLIASAAALRLPQLAGSAVGEGVGEAGFTLRSVEVTGAERVSKLAIYNIAFDQPSMAMPLIDLDATRARILQFGWIKEARVSRRLPDTLLVDLVERRPAAIWQHEGHLSLIDNDGVVLEPVRLEAMPDLPLVIGPAANRHVAGLAGLIDAAPHLRPQLAGASWIGARRWDLRFSTGETLSLPEGDEPARRALAHFARMDQQSRLLGRGFARFDMRIPGKFIVRVSREPGGRVPELAPDPGAAPAPPPQPGEDLSRTI
jgi:cell division protein FtsQ